MVPGATNRYLTTGRTTMRFSVTHCNISANVAPLAAGVSAYRLLFVTADKTPATSNSIAIHHGFVTTEVGLAAGPIVTAILRRRFH